MLQYTCVRSVAQGTANSRSWRSGAVMREACGCERVWGEGGRSSSARWRSGGVMREACLQAWAHGHESARVREGVCVGEGYYNRWPISVDIQHLNPHLNHVPHLHGSLQDAGAVSQCIAIPVKHLRGPKRSEEMR